MLLKNTSTFSATSASSVVLSSATTDWNRVFSSSNSISRSNASSTCCSPSLVPQMMPRKVSRSTTMFGCFSSRHSSSVYTNPSTDSSQRSESCVFRIDFTTGSSSVNRPTSSRVRAGFVTMRNMIYASAAVGAPTC